MAELEDQTLRRDIETARHMDGGAYGRVAWAARMTIMRATEHVIEWRRRCWAVQDKVLELVKESQVFMDEDLNKVQEMEELLKQLPNGKEKEKLLALNTQRKENVKVELVTLNKFRQLTTKEWSNNGDLPNIY